MMRRMIFCFLPVLMPLLSAAYNLPDSTLDPVGNWGPLNLYPDSAKDRLYKMPWDFGRAYYMVDGAYNRPSSHHKGYEYDWAMVDSTPVLAARAGYVNFIGQLAGTGDPVVQIIHIDRDSTGLYNTVDWYIHVCPQPQVVKKGQRVEQGQLIAYSGHYLATSPHLHFEVQMVNHTGVGGFKYGEYQPIESVPAPFVEVTQWEDGIPWKGYMYTSQNRRYVPIDAETGARASGPQAGLEVSPNPFTERVSIKALPAGRTAAISVFSVTGKLLARSKAGRMEWDARDMPAGVYVVKVRFSDETLVSRITLLK